MTPEELLAAAVKGAAALLVLRWPLAGALVSIAADLADIVVMNYVDLGGGGIRDYHAFDKLTDLPALVTFLVASLRFEARERAVAIALFAWRALGVITFELTGLRAALIAAPNLFESWFLFVLLRDRWPGSRGVLLGGLAAFKLAQEWILHGAQVLDRYNLRDLLDAIFRS